MQHPPLQTIVSIPADGGTVAGHRRRSQARASWNAQALRRSPASSAICRQKVAKSSASSRHGSVTGWLALRWLAAQPQPTGLRLPRSGSRRTVGARPTYPAAVHRDERSAVVPRSVACANAGQSRRREVGSLPGHPAGQDQCKTVGQPFATAGVPPGPPGSATTAAAKMFAFAIVDPQAYAPQRAVLPMPIPSVSRRQRPASRRPAVLRQACRGVGMVMQHCLQRQGQEDRPLR